MRAILILRHVHSSAHWIKNFINIRGLRMANAIKYWRKKKSVTQQKLADLIGIDRPTLSKIENPDKLIDPNEEMALKIARELGILVTDILREMTEEEKKELNEIL